ncbi:protoporphyrinogen oxidase (plasmid) [Mycolicibacterium arabiense]|uniref:Coproporphyrinogen III oxidase n=1 Tax=Mycolicibacterium arabiense TaxID=1286181 RepID=A0A7I7RS08_9MYCO|nr:protoporphyrinogen oxidase [Mycolicibacterium arabiense]MCV7372200.1 protoporphyrinogen oxidase [Mycolicibacterium arabiense]BBY46779.1 protoporphyrinogen oxidase [Mycolicibacterium arabiense]
MSPDFGIIGGGISGLVAAYRLRVAAGPLASITLFEPADRLGGALRTERIADQPFDIGAEAFLARRPEVPRLLAELGMSELAIGSRSAARPTLYSGGRHHRMPVGTVMGIPTQSSSMIGLVDDETVARIDEEPARPMHWITGADPSVAELVGDRFGQQVLTRSVDPLLGGVYAGSAATIGVRSVIPAVAAALDGGAANLTAALKASVPAPAGGDVPMFGAIRGGFELLVDELVRASKVQWVRATATRIDSATGGWEVRHGDGQRSRFDGLVLAVPAPRLSSLIQSIAPITAAAATRIEVASAVVVALALPEGTALPDQSGVLVGSDEPLRTKAITLSSRKWAKTGNVELVRVSFGRFGESAAIGASDADLLEWARHDLATIFGIDARPLDSRIHRWTDALPQYGPNHGDLVAELRSGLPPQIEVAGAYLDGIGVPACASSATKAAQFLTAAVMAT